MSSIITKPDSDGLVTPRSSCPEIYRYQFTAFQERPDGSWFEFISSNVKHAVEAHADYIRRATDSNILIVDNTK